MNLIYGELAKDISLRLLKTKNYLSDLIDPSVIWINSTSEANSLVGIRNGLHQKINLTVGIWEKVSTAHHTYFGQSYAFSEASYEEVLTGSVTTSKKFVSAARARWGLSVPGATFCWLADLHARALRAHLRSLPVYSDDIRWVRALDKRSPFSVFGKGSRITYKEYRQLVAIARRHGMGMPIKTQPVELPKNWNYHWKENETENENNTTGYAQPFVPSPNSIDLRTIAGTNSHGGAASHLGA